VQGITQAWRDHGVTIVVSLLLLPLIALLAARLLPRRRLEIAMVAGTLPWLVMAFAPQPDASAVDLVPLRDLATQAAEAPGVLLAQLVGNLLFLAAFGFFAPIRWRALATPGRLLAAGVAVSAAIEVTQYVVNVGRVSSVDDVLLNATGALLAGLASRRWWATTENRVPDVGAAPVR
jgi:glycopeptide antibiotics resistance protein